VTTGPYHAAVDDLTCTRGCGPLTPVVTVWVDGFDHLDPHHYRYFSYTIVAACPVCGVGVLEWFDHDCTGYPTSHSLPVDGFRMFRIQPSDVDALRRAMEPCPDRDSGTCRCAIHESLIESLADLRMWSTERAAVRLTDGRPSLGPGPG
jgi:hypothetical protein